MGSGEEKRAQPEAERPGACCSSGHARGRLELKAAGMPCGGLSLSRGSPWAGEPRAVLGIFTSDELHLFYNFPRNEPADTEQHVSFHLVWFNFLWLKD